MHSCKQVVQAAGCGGRALRPRVAGRGSDRHSRPSGRPDLALALLMGLAAAVTVATVVRLGLLARHDEIEIMELVGAPLTYIRGPFVAEGLLQGGIGARWPFSCLWLSHAPPTRGGAQNCAPRSMARRSGSCRFAFLHS